jgi:hypothetical protein
MQIKYKYLYFSGHIIWQNFTTAQIKSIGVSRQLKWEESGVGGRELGGAQEGGRPE